LLAYPDEHKEMFAQPCVGPYIEPSNLIASVILIFFYVEKKQSWISKKLTAIMLLVRWKRACMLAQTKKYKATYMTALTLRSFMNQS
jgi:hypothetical protein